MPKYKKIPIDVSVHVCYLHKGEDIKHLISKYPEYSKTFLDRHSKLPIGVYQNNKDGRYQNKGRTRLLSDRHNRKIIHCLDELRDTVGNFTSTDNQKIVV